MQDPWSILGLDPNTATEKDVKVAYAKLLKVHRPDKDPEGFQRVRTAYEMACQWMQWKRTETDQEEEGNSSKDEGRSEVTSRYSPHEPEGPTQVSTGGFDDPEISGPPEWRLSVEALRQAVQSGFKERLPAALQALAVDARDLKITGGEVERTLRREFRGHLPLLAQTIPDAVIIGLLATGQAGLVHELLNQWEEEEAKLRPTSLAQSLLNAQFKPIDEGGALALVRVAQMVAFVRHDVAHVLANVAFPALPTDTRQGILTHLEREIALGQIFHGFPTAMRQFWRERLDDPEKTVTWDSTPAKEAVRYVVDYRGWSWDGLGLIRNIVPQSVWMPMEKELKKQAKKAGSPSSGSGDISLRWIWVVVVVVLNIGRCASKESTSQADTSYRLDLPAYQPLPAPTKFERQALDPLLSPPVQPLPATPLPSATPKPGSFEDQMRKAVDQIRQGQPPAFQPNPLQWQPQPPPNLPPPANGAPQSVLPVVPRPPPQ